MIKIRNYNSAGSLEQYTGAWNRVGIGFSYRSARGGNFKLLMSPEIDSKESIPPAYVVYAGIFKQSIRAKNRVGIGFSYRPARLHRLADSILRNRFLGYLKV
jgi:hypothetical protein